MCITELCSSSLKNQQFFIVSAREPELPFPCIASLETSRTWLPLRQASATRWKAKTDNNARCRHTITGGGMDKNKSKARAKDTHKSPTAFQTMVAGAGIRIRNVCSLFQRHRLLPQSIHGSHSRAMLTVSIPPALGGWALSWPSPAQPASGLA
jgi:hypothetical protein